MQRWRALGCLHFWDLLVAKRLASVSPKAAWDGFLSSVRRQQQQHMELRNSKSPRSRNSTPHQFLQQPEIAASSYPKASTDHPSKYV